MPVFMWGSTLRISCFRKHSGVRAAFHREFIRARLLDVKWGKLYDHLFEDRQEGDYIALIAFDPEYVASQNRALWRVPPRITSLDIYLILILRDGSMLSYCPPPIEEDAV